MGKVPLLSFWYLAFFPLHSSLNGADIIALSFSRKKEQGLQDLNLGYASTHGQYTFFRRSPAPKRRLGRPRLCSWTSPCSQLVQTRGSDSAWVAENIQFNSRNIHGTLNIHGTQNPSLGPFLQQNIPMKQGTLRRRRVLPARQLG